MNCRELIQRCGGPWKHWLIVGKLERLVCSSFLFGRGGFFGVFGLDLKSSRSHRQTFLRNFWPQGLYCLNFG